MKARREIEFDGRSASEGLNSVTDVLCCDHVIQGERVQSSSIPTNLTAQELAPGIVLRRQPQSAEPFVEVTLSQAELDRLTENCQHGFVDYATTAVQAAVEGIEGELDESAFGPELAQGLFNMRVLGAALEERGRREVGFVDPLVFEAFRLAARGRMKLTAEPASAK